MASALEIAAEANRTACNYALGPDACAGRSRCLCVAMMRLARRMRSDADKLRDQHEQCSDAASEAAAPDADRDRAAPFAPRHPATPAHLS